MKQSHLSILALAILSVLVSCDRQKVEMPGRSYDWITLKLNEHVLHVEIAADNAARNLGLMHRKHMDENKGMLFVFPAPKPQGFWMKNTLIPLSIAYISDSGKILQIEDMRPKDERSIRSKDPVRYALEVNQGWFKRHNVKVGDTIADFQQTVSRFRG